MKRIVRTAKILFDFSVLSIKSGTLKISMVSFDSSSTSITLSMIFDVIKIQSKVSFREFLYVFAEIQYNTLQWNYDPSESCDFSAK